MNNTSTGLSGGAITGIVVSIVVFVILLGITSYFVCFKKDKKVRVAQRIFTIPQVGANRLKKQ